MEVTVQQENQKLTSGYALTCRISRERSYSSLNFALSLDQIRSQIRTLLICKAAGEYLPAGEGRAGLGSGTPEPIASGAIDGG